MKTKEKLVIDLLNAQAPVTMIEAARDGAYDDCETDSATPINDLINDALSAGLGVIVAGALRGDYDATREEWDEWFKREGHNFALKVVSIKKE